MKKILLVIAVISVLILAGCKNNEEISSNSSMGIESQNQTIITDSKEYEEENSNTTISGDEDYDEFANDKLYGTEKIVYEDDRLVLKTIKFDMRSGDKAGDLFWKYNDNPNVNIIDNDSKLIVEWYGGELESDYENNSDAFYINDNILSLVDFGFEAAGTWGRTFNIDISNRILLSTQEVLSKVNKNIDDMNESMIENYAKSLKEDVEHLLTYDDNDEEYANYLKEEINNVNSSAKDEFSWDKTYFYFNEKNELCFCTHFQRRLLAGSGSCVCLYNITANELIAIREY